MPLQLLVNRPVVFDYTEPAQFFRDLGEYNRKTRRGFSVRARAKNLTGCSPALISQVLSGQRKLKRDQLLNFAKVFALNSTEINHIDALLKSEHASSMPLDDRDEKVVTPRTPKNHLLADWIHPYVKDLVELKDFRPDPKWMLQQLGGVASLAKIEKSIQFLLREGFWRRDSQGKIILEEAAAVTTNEIPNLKIRNFHANALKIAAKGLKEFPVQRRKAATMLVAVNSESMDELKSLINKFQNDLTAFIENHPQQKDELVQVTLHLTPVGGRNA